MSVGDAVLVRAADPDDLAAIVAVFRQCWTQSYAVVLPKALIARLDEPASVELWRGVLDDSPRGSVLVAEDAGEVLGVTRFRTSGTAGHVSSLYVAPSTQGRGVGRTLLTAAVAAMVDGGAVEATLWVFAANAPSRTFYTRMGWTPDGETRVQEQFGEPEVRLRRSLPAPGRSLPAPA
ncbi:MAG TPA: GNAT family N-acetyltransferase [Jiangellaceae bacterium]